MRTALFLVGLALAIPAFAFPVDDVNAKTLNSISSSISQGKLLTSEERHSFVVASDEMLTEILDGKREISSWRDVMSSVEIKKFGDDSMLVDETVYLMVRGDWLWMTGDLSEAEQSYTDAMMLLMKVTAEDEEKDLLKYDAMLMERSEELNKELEVVPLKKFSRKIKEGTLLSSNERDEFIEASETLENKVEAGFGPEISSWEDVLVSVEIKEHGEESMLLDEAVYLMVRGDWQWQTGWRTGEYSEAHQSYTDAKKILNQLVTSEHEVAIKYNSILNERFEELEKEMKGSEDEQLKRSEIDDSTLVHVSTLKEFSRKIKEGTLLSSDERDEFIAASETLENKVEAGVGSEISSWEDVLTSVEIKKFGDDSMLVDETVYLMVRGDWLRMTGDLSKAEESYTDAMMLLMKVTAEDEEKNLLKYDAMLMERSEELNKELEVLPLKNFSRKIKEGTLLSSNERDYFIEASETLENKVEAGFGPDISSWEDVLVSVEIKDHGEESMLLDEAVYLMVRGDWQWQTGWRTGEYSVAHQSYTDAKKILSQVTAEHEAAKKYNNILNERFEELKKEMKSGDEQRQRSDASVTAQDAVDVSILKKFTDKIKKGTLLTSTEREEFLNASDKEREAIKDGSKQQDSILETVMEIFDGVPIHMFGASSMLVDQAVYQMILGDWLRVSGESEDMETADIHYTNGIEQLRYARDHGEQAEEKKYRELLQARKDDLESDLALDLLFDRK